MVMANVTTCMRYLFLSLLSCLRAFSVSSLFLLKYRSALFLKIS